MLSISTRSAVVAVLLAFAISVAGCGEKKAAPAGDKAATSAEGQAGTTAASGVEAKTPSAQPAGGGGSDPVQVVEQVFAAASSGNTGALAGLCDSGGTGDGDVKDLCGLTSTSPKFEEFKTYFSKGKVKGTARIEGDRAEVDFTFGPDGSKEETMKLANIGGKWYLASF